MKSEHAIQFCLVSFSYYIQCIYRKFDPYNLTEWLVSVFVVWLNTYYKVSVLLESKLHVSNNQLPRRALLLRYELRRPKWYLITTFIDLNKGVALPVASTRQHTTPSNCTRVNFPMVGIEGTSLTFCFALENKHEFWILENHSVNNGCLLTTAY